jgi:hypothetical protein
MKKLILLAGAFALASTAAHGLADPGKGKGKGNAHDNHSTMKHGKSAKGVVTSDRWGRMYALNNGGSCPPGLAKKGNGCQPPGQAKKMYDVGDRYRRNFGTSWQYNQIPEYLRTQYTFDQNDRYYYNQGYLYQVDPKTMLIERVVSALLR